MKLVLLCVTKDTWQISCKLFKLISLPCEILLYKILSKESFKEVPLNTKNWRGQTGQINQVAKGQRIFNRACQDKQHRFKGGGGEGLIF
jgi:hypothetical protein